jgi:hypothetical protein
MAEPQHVFPIGHPLRSEDLPSVVGHTDEARALVASGQAQPGDKALDVPIPSMSDRELAEHTVVLLRAQRDAITAFVESVNNSAIGKMLTGGGMSGPLGSMLGGNSGA